MDTFLLLIAGLVTGGIGATVISYFLFRPKHKAEAEAAQAQATIAKLHASVDDIDSFDKLAVRVKGMIAREMVLETANAHQKAVIEDMRAERTTILQEQGAARERERQCQEQLALIRHDVAQLKAAQEA